MTLRRIAPTTARLAGFSAVFAGALALTLVIYLAAPTRPKS